MRINSKVSHQAKPITTCPSVPALLLETGLHVAVHSTTKPHFECLNAQVLSSAMLEHAIIPLVQHPRGPQCDLTAPQRVLFAKLITKCCGNGGAAIGDVDGVLQRMCLSRKVPGGDATPATADANPWGDEKVALLLVLVNTCVGGSTRAGKAKHGTAVAVPVVEPKGPGGLRAECLGALLRGLAQSAEAKPESLKIATLLHAVLKAHANSRGVGALGTVDRATTSVHGLPTAVVDDAKRAVKASTTFMSKTLRAALDKAL